jgi:hypothetical protein
VAQAQVINLDGGKGNFAETVRRADVLFRVQPDFSQPVIKFLASLAEEPRATAAFVDQLARHPIWRGSFFDALAERPKGSVASLRILAALTGKGEILDGADLSPMLNLLIKGGKTEQAYLTWSRFLSADKKAVAGSIFDGGFTFAPTGLPFEWTVRSTAGASIDLVRKSDAESPRVLRMEFVGTRVSDLNIAQILHLAPGQYKLTYQAQAEDLYTPRGIVWRISCWSPPWTQLAESDGLRATHFWLETQLVLKVPTNSCDFQLLKPFVKALSDSEQAVSGIAEFGNFQIIPLIP